MTLPATLPATLIVLRPEPGASATVAAARARGLDAVAAPLFAVRALAWALPAGRFDAVVATSANALRHGGTGLAALRHLPLYAVGAATADAARAAGFGTVLAGEADAPAILARAAADGRTRLLHLVGREHRAVDPPGVAVTRVVVYAADEVAADLPCQGIALVHSPRAAAVLAARVADRARIAIAAISARAAAAAGPGWRAVAVASVPTDAALLATAAGLCDKAP